VIPSHFRISCSLFSGGIAVRATRSEELRSKQTVGREYSDGEEGEIHKDQREFHLAI